MASRPKTVNDLIQSRRKPVKTKELRIYEERIKLGQRRSESAYRAFDRNYEFYLGNQDAGPGYDKRTAVRMKQNLLIVNRVLPALAEQNADILPRIPWFYFDEQQTLDESDSSALKGLEGGVNMLLRQPRVRFLQQARLACLSGAMGIGTLKTTCTLDEGDDPYEGAPEELGEIVIRQDPKTGQEIVDVEGGDPKLVDGEMIVRKNGKVVLDKRDPSRYFHNDAVMWPDMVFEPEGGNNPSNHWWIAERMCWRIDKFMKSPIFSRRAKSQAEMAATDIRRLAFPDSRPADPFGGSQKSVGFGRDSRSESVQTDMLRVWGYQFHNLEDREVVYLVDGLDCVAGKQEFPKWVLDSCYSHFKIHECLGDFLPITEIENARPLIRDYNFFRSMASTHLRRYSRKYKAVEKCFQRSQDVERMKDPEDGSIFFLKRITDLEPLQDAPLDPGIYQIMERDKADMAEIMGRWPNALDTMGASSATQAAIADRRGTSRDEDKRRMIGEVLSESVTNFAECVQGNMDASMSYRILGPEGVHDGIFGGRNLDLRYQVRADEADLDPTAKNAEQQQIIATIEVLTPQIALSSPAYTRYITRRLAPKGNPVIADEWNKAAMALLAVDTRPGASGSTQTGSPIGGPKAVGQGPEGGAAAEGRGAGRAARTAEAA